MALLRSAAQMSVATIISRITGFLRVAALASAMGLQRLADSYNLANVMPNMVYELLLGGILSSLFIPIFIDYLSKDKDEAWHVASTVTNIAILVLTLFALSGIIFAYPLVRLMTVFEPGKSPAVQQSVFFFRFFIPQIVFYGVGAVFTGVLNSHKKFMVPAVAPILNNLIVIATVAWAFVPVYSHDPQAAIINLAIGTTVGVIAMALIQIPPVLKLGWRYRPSLDLRHPAILKLGKLAVPVVGYVACNMVGLAVTYNLAFSVVGGITGYQYAWSFFQLPYGIFAVSISTALFPALSEFVNSKQISSFKEMIVFGLRTTGFIVIPAAAGIFALSRPIIRLVLEHRNFDAAATALTAPVLSCFALGLFSFSSYMFMTRAFYAIKDTKTPLLVNAIGVPLNIILNLAFIGYLGVPGLALGHALTYTVTFMALFILLQKKVGRLDTNLLIPAISKQVASAAVSALLAYIVARLFEPATTLTAQSLQVTAAIITAASVYMGIHYLLKAEELSYVKRIWKREPTAEVTIEGL